MAKKTKTPWPTKQVMNQIYELHLWGGNTFDFYSGFGSHKQDIINSYLHAVSSFLQSQKHALVVCDLGCGDFNIGKQLTKYTQKYIAIDIVEPLIDRNKKRYQEENLEFYCLNIATDKLPDGDCIILRQVLQHLSNNEIESITKKLVKYKYIILTEHLPMGDFEPNKDIISGQGIRLKQNSGVNILVPPFSLKIKDQKLLDEHILEHSEGRIVTILFQLY